MNEEHLEREVFIYRREVLLYRREVFVEGLATKLTFRVEWEDVDHRVPWESVSKPFIIPLKKREATNDVDFGPVMDASDLDVDSIDGLDKLLEEIENEETI